MKYQAHGVFRATERDRCNMVPKNLQIKMTDNLQWGEAPTSTLYEGKRDTNERETVRDLSERSFTLNIILKLQTDLH